MSTNREPSRPLYVPRKGELVRDEQHQCDGVFMGRNGQNLVSLRPEAGGIEWDTPASAIQPLPGEPKLIPVIRAGTPRDATQVRLSGERA
ncbi:hypothetical protein ABH930_001452 [Kitasatospora sp. GAS204A]|nr:hypothetical protein [Kitasatospora sp. GAS204B]